MKSPKETALDRKILKTLDGICRDAVEYMISDPEITHLQDYANTVSIKRLNYNDHGPVHMRKVALNAIVMAGLLRKNGIKFSLEKEGCGTYEDSLVAVVISAFLHDTGMSIGRQDHEKNSVVLAAPIIERILRKIYVD